MLGWRLGRGSVRFAAGGAKHLQPLADLVVSEALVGQESVDPQGAIPQTIDVSLPDTPVVSGLPPAVG